MVVALIGGFLTAAAVSQVRLVRRAKELVLRADLQSLRVGIAFFEARRGRSPESLNEVLIQPIGSSRRGGRAVTWSLQDRGAQRVDVFGTPYRYNTATGDVRSLTPGYEAW